jgi:pyruvate carboxylase
MSNAMYPAVFNEFEQFRAEYGPVDKLPTKVFLAGLDNGESTEVCYTLKHFFTIYFRPSCSLKQVLLMFV